MTHGPGTVTGRVPAIVAAWPPGSVTWNVPAPRLADDGVVCHRLRAHARTAMAGLLSHG